MRRRWFVRGLMFLPVVLAFAALLSFVVMQLWNWLLPPLFGWHMIGFWQAVGLLILCKILFGGFRHRHGPPWHWRRRMMERWEQMTPEEREKFRESMRVRCGGFDAPAETPKA
jgi:hypothetical protein